MSEKRHICNQCAGSGNWNQTGECLECGGSGRVTYAFPDHAKYDYRDRLKPQKVVDMDLIIAAMKRKKNK